MKKIGFFEVDSRQRAKSRECLVFTPRTVRLRNKLEHLQSVAEKIGAPFIFTTCCAERFVSQANPAAGTLVVPRDPAETGWIQELPACRMINIEKKPEWGDYKKDHEDLVWDMFLHNANTDKLFEKLGVTHWIAYGIGIDLCVSSAAKGLLKLGYDVTVLSDVLVSNAGGTKKTMAQMLDRLYEMGATVKTYSEFIRDF
ncbi:MAG: isochorismatase family protein [Planctomycetia bacterium]|jgi:nicotinamidase-related amidase